MLRRPVVPAAATGLVAKCKRGLTARPAVLAVLAVAAASLAATRAGRLIRGLAPLVDPSAAQHPVAVVNVTGDVGSPSHGRKLGSLRLLLPAGNAAVCSSSLALSRPLKNSNQES